SENDAPHLGAQIAWKKAGANHTPAAVSLPDPVSDGPYTTPGQKGGFLGAAYAPFTVQCDPNDEGFVVQGLNVGNSRVCEHLASRRELLEKLQPQLERSSSDSRTVQLESYQRRA